MWEEQTVPVIILLMITYEKENMEKNQTMQFMWKIELLLKKNIS